MPKNISLHNIKVEDGATLAYIHKLCFDKPWSEETFVNFLQNPICPHTFGWIVRNPIPLGFLLCGTTVDTTEILTLAVNPEHQRKGIGTILIKTLVTTCPHTIFLEVAVDNAKAINLYKKFGFKTISIRKNYYDQIQGPPQDAYLMKKPCATGEEDF